MRNAIQMEKFCVNDTDYLYHKMSYFVSFDYIVLIAIQHKMNALLNHGVCDTHDA